MQILLLSGGPGLRLWPLSNEARSKQFLSVLQAPDGKVESMVQRAVRQIRDSQLTGPITVAVNENHRDLVSKQLGTCVDVVKEPQYRETFPAVALACSYLRLEKGCSDDEIVVVMPCDVATDPSYFDAVASMAAEVECNAASLVLMGVRPHHPSTESHYIIPGAPINGGPLVAVKSYGEGTAFQEKEEQYRNGNVYVFRLGYLRKIGERYVQADTYEDVVARFCRFPRVSFFQEVVGVAPSAALYPFDGKWQDWGTWSTLTESLPQPTSGNVIFGEKNENTHVVNALDLPMYCDGLKDLVVAASPDGIMVCSKERSENIKPFAEHLNERPMFEERRWGSYEVLKTVDHGDGTKQLTKYMVLDAGKSVSYQSHHKRKEVWTITNGTGVVVLDDVVREVNRGDVIIIEKEQKHSIKATTHLEFIEVQLGTELVESDIERFPWEW